MTQKTNFGMFAENLAAQYLRGRGYEVLDQNYRKKWGEIDIVAQKKGILVFVEVKASSMLGSGFEPELRAGRTKMTKVIRTARTYLAYKKYSSEQPWQLDVVSITLDKINKVAKVKHFKNID